jgi:hypothetical protein
MRLRAETERVNAPIFARRRYFQKKNLKEVFAVLRSIGDKQITIPESH